MRRRNANLTALSSLCSAIFVWASLPATAAEVLPSAPGSRAPRRGRDATLPVRLLVGPDSPLAGSSAAKVIRWGELDTRPLLAEDRRRARQARVPLRIGVNRGVHGGAVSLLTVGTRSQTSDGTSVWSLKLEAPGAIATRVHFSRFDVPEGTRVVVADEAGEKTRAYVKRGYTGEGNFWSATVGGDSVHIEYQDPTSRAVQPVIEIDEISHIYADPAAAALPIMRPGAAPALLACQQDVNCHTVDQTARDSIGQMTFTVPGEGTYVCTGALLNDSDSNTSAGYFLTANHCLSTQAVVNNLQVAWFYDTDSCDGTPSVAATSLGGTLLATGHRTSSTDFTFIRLRDDPHDGQGFAAWTTGAPSGTVTGIHHPGGSYKRVSFGERTTDQPICNPDLALSRFWYLDWDTGITEGGSSGSPLFNSSWQVVGQLYGVCYYDTPGCGNPQDFNVVYGKLMLTYLSIVGYLTSTTPDDGYEDNDSLAEAAELELGEHDLSLVDFDDFFRIRVCDSNVITATATFSTTDMDLNLELLTEAGDVVDTSNSTTGTETISAAVGPGIYIVRVVKAHLWGGDYTLSLSLDTAADCNNTGLLDACDILDGTSFDDDGDGVPDECVFPPVAAPAPFDFRKNRFIAFTPNNPSSPIAIRVEVADLACSISADPCSYDADCADGETCLTQTGDAPGSAEADDDWEAIGWVGIPCQVPQDTQVPADTFTSLVVNDMPAMLFFTEAVVFVTDCDIQPRRSYALSTTANGTVFSDRLVIGTILEPLKNDKRWADVVGQRDAGTGEYTEPNERINVDDVMVMVVFLNSKPYRPHLTVLDLSHEVPGFKINADDLQMVMRAFNITEDYPPLKFQVEASGAVHPRECPPDAAEATHSKCN